MEQGQMTHSKIKAFSSSMEESRRSRSDNRSIQGKRALEQSAAWAWNCVNSEVPLCETRLCCFPFDFAIFDSISFQLFRSLSWISELWDFFVRWTQATWTKSSQRPPLWSLCIFVRQVLHQRLCHLVRVCNRQRRMDQSDLHLEDLPDKNQVMVLFRFLWVCRCL